MRRIESLQGLRGWAILLVVLWHLNPLFPGSLPRLGNVGVDFFLMLSGFLVARKCASADAMPTFRSFAASAFRKLKGSYLLYMVPAVPVFLLDVFAGPVRPSSPLLRVLAYGTLTQSWVPASWIYWGVNSAGWFLPVLLFCYLATPVVRKAAGRFGARPLLLAVLVLQAGAELLAGRFLSEALSDWLLYICPAWRVLDFTLGFCAWSLFASPGRRLSPRSLDALYLSLLAVLAGLLLLRPDVLKYVLFHPFELALLWVVASERSALSNALNRNRVLVRLGDLSPVVFLTHVPVIRLTGMLWRRLFGPDLAFPQWIVSLILVFLCAAAADRLLRRRKSAK